MLYDFKNNRGLNLADPKYDKDAINFRTLRRYAVEIVVSGKTLDIWTGSTGTSSAVIKDTNNSASGNYSAVLGGDNINATQDNALYTQNLRAAQNGGIIYSAGTNLYNIFAPIGSDTNTFISNFQYDGSNKFTITRSDSNQFNAVINQVSGLTVNGNLSASTIYSGSTDLYDIFLTTADGNDITRIQPGTNINTGGTANEPVINLNNNISVTSVSANTISGETIYSGSTDVSDLFKDWTLQTDFESHTGDTNNPHQVTASQIGTYTTSETDNLLDTKADLSGATFTGTIDAPTILSGGTDLSDIFISSNNGVTGSGSVNNIPLWNGTQNLTDSIMSQNGTSGVTVAGDVYIEGNVEVLGTATTINTQDLAVKDNNIILNSGGTHTSANNGGIIIEDGVSTGSDSSWLIDGDGDWYTEQKVGIGGADPAERLDVDGNIILRGVNNLKIGSGNFGGEFDISSGIRGFKFSNNNGDHLVIDADGKVGIGENTPVYTLDVVGGNNIMRLSNPTGNAIIRLDAGDTSDSGLFLASDGLKWGVTNDQSLSNSIRFYNYALAETAMIIRGDSGNVGIGTSNTPTSKLHVQGTMNVNDILIVDSNSPYGYKGQTSNTFYGRNSMLNSTGLGSVVDNVAIGYDSLREVVDNGGSVDGSGNVAVGTNAMRETTVGFRNVGIGVSALLANTSGNSNVAIGYGALRANTTGSANFSLGRSNFFELNGDRNVSIGNYGGRFLETGDDNILIGDNAGLETTVGNLTNSSSSILIGKSTKTLNDNSLNEIVIGDSAEGNGSNTTTIGNNTTTDTHLRGELHVDVERWTIDFMNSLSTTIYASEDISIEEIDDIVNSPTTTITLSGSSYTLGDPIVSGDEIGISVDTSSVIKLKVKVVR